MVEFLIMKEIIIMMMVIMIIIAFLNETNLHNLEILCSSIVIRN